MLEVGKFYLFAVPYFWTFAGRFLCETFKYRMIDHALYFTQTGATFDILSTKGFQSGTKYHAENQAPMGIPNEGPWWQWQAATPWARKIESVAAVLAKLRKKDE